MSPRTSQSKPWRDDVGLWLSVGQFVIGTSVSLVTVFVLLLYDSRLKDLDRQLQERNVQRLSQSPLIFRSSVQLEPYGGGAYRLVTLNYSFQNVGMDTIGVRQVVVRAFLHKAISLVDQPPAVQAPNLDRAVCLDAHDSWVEYARPETYDARPGAKIWVAGNGYTAAQGGGGLAELEPKTVSGGSAVYIVRATDDDFLGFLVCVEHYQVTTSPTEIAKIKPWKNAIVFRAKNMNWTFDGSKL
ncbi:MAG: hypothetical protein ABI612_25030 [Betaproteobacteria bacterium]